MKQPTDVIQNILDVWYAPEKKGFKYFASLSDTILTILLVLAGLVIIGIGLWPEKPIVKAIVLGYVLLP